MNSEIDLRQLAVEREPSAPASSRPRRAILSRYVLPGVVLLGFVSLVAWAARDHLRTSKPVTVVPVVVSRAEVKQSGEPLFQAAGWIEPRPTSMLAAALAEGVVEELLVVEGQEVAAGEPVARLIDADARLALRRARADLELKESELESARAELEAARLRHDNPLHLQAALAEAQSQLARVEGNLARLPSQIQAARARLDYAQRNLEGKRSAGGAVSGRVVQQAESEQAGAAAELQELEERRPRLERERNALHDRAGALEKQLQLLIDERRSLAEAQARLQSAKTGVRRAELAVEEAQLRLDRMIVRSPKPGRVLELIAQPGSRLAGGGSRGAVESSAVVSLYDPAMLQVRADVRLEDVPQVVPGQPVQVETASASEPIAGEVLYPTSSANIQKNTLDVKVALIDPPASVRPEMLVSATFLAPEQPKSQGDESEDEQRLLAPRELVESDGESHTVWIAAAGNVARRQGVTLGRAGTDELVEIVEGLQPTDKLIVEGRATLEEGDWITVSDDN